MTVLHSRTLLWAVTAAFVGTAVYFRRAALSELADRRYFEATTTDLRAQLHELEIGRTATNATQADTAVSPTSGAATANPSKRPQWKATDYSKLLRDHPELQSLQTAANRALIRSKYDPLFRQLRLSEENVGRFAENITLREERQQDTFAALAAQNLTYQSPEAQKLTGESLAEYDQAQRELLGADGFAAWKDYERTVFIREAAASFAGAATLRGSPMTTQQVEKLSQAMASSSASYRKGGFAVPNDLDWAMVLNEIQGFLTEEQRTAVSEVEPHGAMGSGGRRLMQLQAAINRAAEADKLTDTTGAPSH
jgi:hypothetical protein